MLNRFKLLAVIGLVTSCNSDSTKIGLTKSDSIEIIEQVNAEIIKDSLSRLKTAFPEYDDFIYNSNGEIIEKPDNAISLDADGDDINDFAWIDFSRVNLEEMRSCLVYLKTSNPNIKPLEVSACRGFLVNLGDITGNGKDDIQLFTMGLNGTWGSVQLLTLENNEYKSIIENFAQKVDNGYDTFIRKVGDEIQILDIQLESEGFVVNWKSAKLKTN